MAKGFSNNDAVLMIVEMIRDKVIQEVYSTELDNQNYKRYLATEPEEEA
jgi:hypothetical protein